MTVCGVESSSNVMVFCCQFSTHVHTEPQIKVMYSLTIWGKSIEELGISFFLQYRPSVQPIQPLSSVSQCDGWYSVLL